jgi:hypothetical protein
MWDGRGEDGQPMAQASPPELHFKTPHPTILILCLSELVPPYSRTFQSASTLAQARILFFLIQGLSM